jgi:hypothetical protein
MRLTLIAAFFHRMGRTDQASENGGTAIQNLPERTDSESGRQERLGVHAASQPLAGESTVRWRHRRRTTSRYRSLGRGDPPSGRWRVEGRGLRSARLGGTPPVREASPRNEGPPRPAGSDKPGSPSHSGWASRTPRPTVRPKWSAHHCWRRRVRCWCGRPSWITAV